MVTEEFPDWEWLEYTTNDIGFVMNIRDYNYGYLVLDVYFFKDHLRVTVPSYFVESLRQINESR